MYLKGRFVKYLILLSTWEWANMLALCKCMYIFIIGNQLTTQNNDRYCPETLTGTAFSIKKYAQIITWQTAAQQSTTAVSVSVCWLDYDLPQTACDYHKVGMSVKGRLVGTHRTHFHSHIWRSEVKGPLWKWPWQFFLAKSFWSVILPPSPTS